jgi:cation diffusion facilitator family transporter
MFASIFVKAGASISKLVDGRKLRSEALIADAHHDGVEIVSGIVALTAVGLSIYDPAHFGSADHWGGFVVGLFVLFAAWFVVREASSELMDVMPEQRRIEQIRRVALRVSGVLGVEKIFARKTGLNYHVELHLEVNPGMAVRDAHAISSEIPFLVWKELDWVADVVVHIEPGDEG